MFEVVKIRNTEHAVSLIKDWERAYQHMEERAMIYELLMDAARLELAVANREINRLRGLLK